MGGCVSTIVQVRNSVSVASSDEVRDYRSRRDRVHGCFAVPVAGNNSSKGKCNGTPAYRLAGVSDEMHARLMRGESPGAMNYVEQLRQLCMQRSTHRALAYRPVDRVCTELVSSPSTSPGAHDKQQKQQQSRRSSGNSSSSSSSTRELSVTYLRPTCYMTYGELWERIDAFGRGLHELGLQSRTRMSIYLDTCVEWVIAIYGMWVQDMIAVTVYANLGDDALIYALRETASGAILTSAAQVPMLLQLMQQGIVPRTPIVYTGTLTSEQQQQQKQYNADGVDESSNNNSNNNSSINDSSDGDVVATSLQRQLYSVDELLELGRAQRKTLTNDAVPSRLPSTITSPHAPPSSSTPSVMRSRGGVPHTTMCSNSDVALIMYTSGTTGNPKGVVHTHGSLFYGATVLGMRVTDLLGPTQPEDSYCAYLPLAHILEFTVMNVFLARGYLIGFGSPRTLTDATARPHGDLREYRPAIVVGVPRIFDTVRKAIEARLPPHGTLKRRIFDTAYASRLRALKEGKDTPYYNTKVFGPVRELFGGRVRAMLSGGGPLSTATQEFVRVVLGSIVIGWGLTETVCIGAIQLVGDVERNVTGNLIAGSELKLVDVEGYTHKDTPEPRGEVCVRGPFLFKGYYKQPELTREVLDDDGWFHTGDVGSITADGKVRIVGRIKALAKNALGEYIALEALEAMYCSNTLCIPGCVCVLVHADKSYITALVLTDKDKAMAFAREHGIDGAWPDVLQNPALHKAAAASLAATARAAGRKPFECVKQVRVLADEWTPENGLLTAAMKLRRHAIDAKYADVIAALFAGE